MQAHVATLAVSFTTFVTVSLASWSCTGRNDGAEQLIGPVSDGVRAVAAAELELALRLHRELTASDEAGNVIVSPHSIWRALGMTREGARGQTRDEFDLLLGIGALSEPDQVRHDIKALGAHLERAAGKKIELEAADMVWTMDGLVVDEATKADIRFAYGAELQSLDFRDDPAQALETINRWITDNTRGRVESMLESNAVNVDTELALTNALFFKGDWRAPFDPDRTRPRPFTLANGETVETPFMHLLAAETLLTGEFIDADANVSAKLVELPYEGGAYSLCLIVPNAEDGLDELESWLTVTRLRDGLAAMKPRETLVALPKLTVDPRLRLVGALKALGLQSAFDAKRADFGGFSKEDPLAINSVDHAVFLEFSEEGTEVAAATSVTELKASLPEEIAADRPFLFLLQEKATGTPIIFGRVVDPTE